MKTGNKTEERKNNSRSGTTKRYFFFLFSIKWKFCQKHEENKTNLIYLTHTNKTSEAFVIVFKWTRVALWECSFFSAGREGNFMRMNIIITSTLRRKGEFHKFSSSGIIVGNFIGRSLCFDFALFGNTVMCAISLFFQTIVCSMNYEDRLPLFGRDSYDFLYGFIVLFRCWMNIER